MSLRYRLKRIRDRLRWYNQSLSSISEYAGAIRESSKHKRTMLKPDMFISVFRYGIKPDEYYRYGFAEKSADERHEYIGDIPLRLTVRELNRSSKNNKALQDKYSLYEKLGRFFGRKMVLFEKDKGLTDDVRSFIDCSDGFIYKPRSSNYGKGIRIVRLNDQKARMDFEVFLAGSACDAVLEELIDQDEKLAQFHPSSVNTIRAITMNGEKGFAVLYTMIRIGVGGSSVDNASAGGLFALIDKDTGIIITDGMQRNGARWPSHPDTGVPINGVQIPCWDELKAMLNELVSVMPEPRLIGWDLALSKNGWVIVEGNDGPSFSGGQVCLGRGLRREAEEGLGIKFN